MPEAFVTLEPSVGFRHDPTYTCIFDNDEKTQQKARTVQELLESASRGCAVCFLHHCTVVRTIADICPSDEVYTVHASPFDSVTVGTPNRPIPWRNVAFFVQSVGISASLKSCEFFGSAVGLPAIEKIPLDGTASSASLETTLEWLRHCAAEHPSCEFEYDPKLPTRVVNIKNDHVSLCETSTEHGKYACLSHCWGPQGDTAVLRTLRSSLSRYKTRIDWHLLPRTFQDAIVFARKLKLDWIWIDSLCIVQDDPLDWATEAARMASIYQNAYITLGATKASHANGGLFNSPKIRILNAVKTPLNLVLSGHETVIYAGAELDHVDLYPRPMETVERSPFPLLDRAWVYQERLLSRRFLHFAPYELNWECRERTQCECGGIVDTPDDMNFQIRTRVVTNFISDSSRYPTHFFTGTGKKPLMRSGSLAQIKAEGAGIWRWLIEHYTCLGITFSKDVFPALAGLAQRWDPTASDQYLAGLWKNSLIDDLLWETQDWRVEAQRPMPWRAPTWSWASVMHTPIGYAIRSPVAEKHVEIVEVTCTPTSTSQTGEISSARLVLSARSLPGAIFHLDKADGSQLESKFLFSHFRCILTIKTQTGFYSPHPGFSPDVPSKEKLSPYAVKVLMMADTLQDGSITRIFLVLKERKSEPQGYERVGLFKLNLNSSIGCIEAYAEAHSLAARQTEIHEAVEQPGRKITEALFKQFEQQSLREFKIY